MRWNQSCVTARSSRRSCVRSRLQRLSGSQRLGHISSSGRAALCHLRRPQHGGTGVASFWLSHNILISNAAARLDLSFTMSPVSNTAPRSTKQVPLPRAVRLAARIDARLPAYRVFTFLPRSTLRLAPTQHTPGLTAERSTRACAALLQRWIAPVLSVRG